MWRLIRGVVYIIINFIMGSWILDMERGIATLYALLMLLVVKEITKEIK